LALKEKDCDLVSWMQLSEEKIQWCGHVNTAMEVQKKEQQLLAN
jgi:hypothetical protein